MADFKLNDANSSPVVDSPPFFQSGTITSGSTVTISFDNVTQRINIGCTSGAGQLKFGVSTAGVGGTAFNSLVVSTSTGVIDMKIKQLVLTAVGADMGYSLVAVLDRTASADYPDITTGNGFAGV